MSKVVTGNKVKVHYKGWLSDGTEFDSSEGRDPLAFTLGEGKVIPGFDKAVLDLAVGESGKVDIPCNEAYGPHHTEMVMEVDRNQFPVDVPLSIGQHFQFDSNDGTTHVFRATTINDDTVMLDGNHPLAGKDLTFEITLVEIC